jgi:hypothetical protein
VNECSCKSFQCGPELAAMLHNPYPKKLEQYKAIAVAIGSACRIEARKNRRLIEQQAAKGNRKIRVIDTGHPTHVVFQNGNWCPFHQIWHWV